MPCGGGKKKTATAQVRFEPDNKLQPRKELPPGFFFDLLQWNQKIELLILVGHALTPHHAMSYSRTDPGLQRKVPKQLWYLFFSEMWERFCFYGMRGMLTVFMVDKIVGLNMREDVANLQYGATQAFVYAFTFIGDCSQTRSSDSGNRSSGAGS